MSAVLSAKRIAGLEMVQDGKVFFWRAGGSSINYESFVNGRVHDATMRWLNDSGYLTLTKEEHGTVTLSEKGVKALEEAAVPA